TYSSPIVNFLVEISQKCPKLEDLTLGFDTDLIDSNIEIFNSMKYFKNLKRLNLTLDTSLVPDIPTHFTCNALRECPLLTNFYFSANFESITELFFEEIDRNAPNLRVLDVSNVTISEKTLDIISRL